MYEALSRMARDPLSFFHGAEDVFYKDLRDPRPWGGTDAAPTALLIGDAHVLNLGTFRNGRGVLVYDYTSLAGATPGAVTRDLYRLLVSLVLLADELAIDVPNVEELLHQAIIAYHDGVLQFSEKTDPASFAFTAEQGNPYVRRILREASHRIRADLLDRWTVMNSAGRQFRKDLQYEPLRPFEFEMFQKALLEANLGISDPRYLQIRDGVRHVAEHSGFNGREKVYLLIEGPTPSPSDDLILEVSMPRGAPLPGCNGPKGPPAQTVIEAAHRLLESPAPFLGTLTTDRREYVIRELQPWETRLSVSELAGLDDLYDIARTAATLLARAHVLTGSVQPLQEFVKSWDQEGEAAREGLTHFALSYAAQVRADYREFVGYLHHHPSAKSHEAAAAVTKKTSTVTPAVVTPAVVPPGTSGAGSDLSQAKITGPVPASSPAPAASPAPKTTTGH